MEHDPTEASIALTNQELFNMVQQAINNIVERFNEDISNYQREHQLMVSLEDEAESEIMLEVKRHLFIVTRIEVTKIIQEKADDLVQIILDEMIKLSTPE